MTETPSPVGAEPVTYEYATVRAERDLESLYRDTYASFGWIVEGYGATVPNVNAVTLKLKRPRRIRNRPQVVELQRKAEHALAEITALEKSKSTSAFVTALSVGVVGLHGPGGAGSFRPEVDSPKGWNRERTGEEPAGPMEVGPARGARGGGGGEGHRRHHRKVAGAHRLSRRDPRMSR